MIIHYDLFAGIGGFSLALDTVFYEKKIKHIFCEWDAFCTAVLKKHWPQGVFYGDIDKLAEELTGLPAKEYNSIHGLSTVEKIRQRSKPLSKRDVSARHRELLRSVETSDVGDIETQGREVSEQSSVWDEQPFSPRNESERQSSEHGRVSTEKRNVGEEYSVRNVRIVPSNEKRKNSNTGTSRRLQQTTGSDVVVPEMPPQMAQRKQADTSFNKTTKDDKEKDLQSRRKGECEKQIKRFIEKNGKPNIISGGFPCPSFSHAGRRKGTEDARYKWPQMLSIIHATKPDWVIAENVRGLVSWEQGLALETVLTNLEECGYSAQPLIIPACAVNAPHRRDRVWIIASATGKRQCARGGNWKTRQVLYDEEQFAKKNKQKWSERKCGAKSFYKNTSDCTNARVKSVQERKDKVFEPWNKRWQEVAFATSNDTMDDGLPRKVDGVSYSFAKWRKESLKAYGNAIVPQVAMEIFKAIKDIKK